MKILIADDEALAREGLKLQLKAAGYGQDLSECENGPDAVACIRKQRPDLVFLDINMPGCDGFGVIEAVGAEQMPLVVFLTAYDEHAIRAFRVNALDYLLKPVSEARLEESLQRAREALVMRDSNEQQQRLGRLLDQLAGGLSEQPPERMMIRNAGHVFFLRLDEIHWVEAEGDYVTIHTAVKGHLVRDTMKNMEARLDEKGFQRIHRSTLVRLDYIRELIANDSGDYQVILKDDTELKLSRSFRDRLYARLAAR